jgi:hypothetical protein
VIEVEEDGGGVDDGDVDRAVAAFVGEDEGDARWLTSLGMPREARRSSSRASVVTRSGGAAVAKTSTMAPKRAESEVAESWTRWASACCWCIGSS